MGWREDREEERETNTAAAGKVLGHLNDLLNFENILHVFNAGNMYPLVEKEAQAKEYKFDLQRLQEKKLSMEKIDREQALMEEVRKPGPVAALILEIERLDSIKEYIEAIYSICGAYSKVLPSDMNDRLRSAFNFDDSE